MSPQAVGTDPKKRIALVACNRATADFLISSPLMTSTYERILPDFENYRDRFKNPE